RLEGAGNSITGTESTAEFVLTGRMNGPGDVILKELTIGGTVDNSNAGLVAILGDVKISKPAGIDAVGDCAWIVIDDSGPTAAFAASRNTGPARWSCLPPISTEDSRRSSRAF